MAAQTERSVEEVLASWLESAVTELPVEELPDEEVLALTELQLTGEQQASLDKLLAQNREGALGIEEQKQLDELMRLTNTVCFANLRHCVLPYSVNSLPRFNHEASADSRNNSTACA